MSRETTEAVGGAGDGMVGRDVDPTGMVAARVVRRLGGTPESDLVAVESPLAIDLEWRANDTYRRERVFTTLRTPGHDAELALGWLRAEGVVTSADEVVSIVPCIDDAERSGRENVLRVRLADRATSAIERATEAFASPDAPGRRQAMATAACGVCGRATIEALESLVARVRDGAPRAAGEAGAAGEVGAAGVAGEVGAARENHETRGTHDRPAGRWAILRTAPSQLEAAQAGYRGTGGLHAAGLLDASGRLVLVREDVGRHNAVDKVFGAALGGGVDVGSTALVVTSRAGFEIVQKAAAAGCPTLATMGAATSLAVDAAAAVGLTLIGFLRPDRCTVYTGGLEGL